MAVALCLRLMFDGSQAGKPRPRYKEAAMTTGTVLAFIFTGITAPVAIVSGIWLEARMPVPQPQLTGPSRDLHRPHPAGLLADGHRADLRQPAPD
jgi:hypothetical protein